MGEGWGKQGQFTSNLRRRWTIPVTTTGGYQVSGKGVQRGTKGTARGAGESARGAREKCAMYICDCNVYAKE